MRLKMLALVVAVLAAFAACNSPNVNSPDKPSGYGNPEVQLGLPVVHSENAWLEANPPVNSYLHKGDTITLKFHYTLQSYQYPHRVTGWLNFWKVESDWAVSTGYADCARERRLVPAASYETLECRFVIDDAFLVHVGNGPYVSAALLVLGDKGDQYLYQRWRVYDMAR